MGLSDAMKKMKLVQGDDTDALKFRGASNDAIFLGNLSTGKEPSSQPNVYQAKPCAHGETPASSSMDNPQVAPSLDAQLWLDDADQSEA